MGDLFGVSHANMCLARVYQEMGDEDKFEQYRHASLEGCRRRGDINNQGKVGIPLLLDSMAKTTPPVQCLGVFFRSKDEECVSSPESNDIRSLSYVCNG